MNIRLEISDFFQRNKNELEEVGAFGMNLDKTLDKMHKHPLKAGAAIELKRAAIKAHRVGKAISSTAGKVADYFKK
jgi:hypothetical protein